MADQFKGFVVAYREIENLSVDGLVARQTAGITKALKSGRQFEAFDLVNQTVAGPARLVNQTLKAYAKHGARGSRRKVRNRLGFDENASHAFRHVLGGAANKFLGINDFLVNHEGELMASRTAPQANPFGRVKLASVFLGVDARAVRSGGRAVINSGLIGKALKDRMTDKRRVVPAMWANE